MSLSACAMILSFLYFALVFFKSWGNSTFWWLQQPIYSGLLPFLSDLVRFFAWLGRRAVGLCLSTRLGEISARRTAAIHWRACSRARFSPIPCRYRQSAPKGFWFIANPCIALFVLSCGCGLASINGHLPVTGRRAFGTAMWFQTLNPGTLGVFGTWSDFFGLVSILSWFCIVRTFFVFTARFSFFFLGQAHRPVNLSMFVSP